MKHNLFKAGMVALMLTISSAHVFAQQAPSFNLPGDKKMISLDELKGKVIYLDFWASWCGPCRKSFPWMNEIHNRYDKNKFQIIAVNVDSSREDADKFLKYLPASFEIAYDPEGKVADKYKLKAMPSSFIIDKEGNLVLVHKGYKEGDTDKIENKIAALIDK